MLFNFEDYKKKVLACWMGKNIGGTLGAPDEWARQKNNIDFYKQKLNGEPIPNDDLDIQLIWLIAIEEQGIDINSAMLGEYFSLYVTPHWNEYGTAKINMKRGLIPPLSGTMNNYFKHSCGAFIRSEIWACIAPGYPEVAIRYALEDAKIDHGNGEGVYAEIFCTALESAAFVESDINKLIDIGLSYISPECGVSMAVINARNSFQYGKTWEEARDEMLSKYRGKGRQVSEEDKEKGFEDGILGWDAPSNIGIIVIGLLYGEGDFGKSLCTAVNCGEDTDCTAATIGAILGIICGIDAIPKKWVEPIGIKIKTACLNLGELEDPASSLPKRWQIAKERQVKPINGGMRRLLPDTIEELTDRLIRITRQVVFKNNLDLQFDNNKATDLSGLNKELLFASQHVRKMYEYLGGPVFDFGFFEVYLDYGIDALIRDNESKKLKLRIENKYKVPVTMGFKWHLSEGWNISPSRFGQAYIPISCIKDFVEIEFIVQAEKVVDNIHRSVIELTIDGRSMVMHVPVVLINGNYETGE